MVIRCTKVSTSHHTCAKLIIGVKDPDSDFKGERPSTAVTAACSDANNCTLTAGTPATVHQHGDANDSIETVTSTLAAGMPTTA